MVDRARRSISEGSSSEQLEETRLALRRQLDESRRLVREQKTTEASTSTSTPQTARRPGPPPETQTARPQSVLSDETPRRGSAAALLAGLVAAAVGIALFAGVVVAGRSEESPQDAPTTTSETVITSVAGVDLDAVADAVRDRGYYLAPAIEDPDGLISDSVAAATDAGIGFGAVVIAEDPPEGAMVIASEIEDRIGGGTVLVLTATRAGISSSEFGDDVLNRALEAGGAAFGAGGDPGYVDAVVEVLLESQ
jgi:hypothetical protein